MHNSERNELQSAVEEKMRKMFFSQPVINRYFETASFADIEKMNCLLDDEQEVRRIARRARYIKTANFPTMKSFDDYDFSGIKFLHTAFKKGHWSVEKGTSGGQKRTILKLTDIVKETGFLA